MNQQQYGMPSNQMHPQSQQQQQQGGMMGQPMSQQQYGAMQSHMHPQMNSNYQQHYMNAPQGPESQQHLAQPSPQIYTQPSPYSQQHSVGSLNAPPGSVSSVQAHTPQQNLGIPQQRSTDGRFASPQSITQRSPANPFSNQQQTTAQSTSQSAGQSTSQPTNQSMQQHPSITQSGSLYSSNNLLPGQSYNQPIQQFSSNNLLTGQSYSQPIQQYPPTSQLGGQSNTQPIQQYPPISQSIPQYSSNNILMGSQSNSQPVQQYSSTNQLTSQSTSQHVQQHPSTSQSTGEPTPGPLHQQEPSEPFPTDPLQANRILIVRDLRRAIYELSQSAAYLFALKFTDDTEHFTQWASCFEPLSAGTPASGNPASNAPPQNKEQRAPPTEEELTQSRHRFTNAMRNFLSVSDVIERNYNTVIEAHRQCQIYDALSAVKVPSDLAQHPYVELIQPSLDTMAEDCFTLERSIMEMDNLLREVHKAESRNEGTRK